MKILTLVLFMLFAWNGYSQESEQVNPKLEALRNEKNKATLERKIKALENGTVEDLDVLIQYYAKDKVKKEEISKMMLKKYPNTLSARMVRMQLFLPLSDPTEVETLVKTMIKDYPGINLDLEKNMAALTYAEVPDTAKALLYVNMMEDPIYKVFSVKLMMDIIEGFDNAMALNLGTKVLPEVLRLKSETALSAKVQVDPQMVYDEFINAYAKLLVKAERYDEAYSFTKEAYDSMEGREDRELIENYAFLSSRNGNYKESLPVLSDAIRMGKNDPKYIEQVRNGYVHLYPEADVNTYIAGLKQEFKDNVKAHVASLMIKEKAPDFTVTDVNGKKVSLADFKGKTILLDFWATWCGPCVASFPGMQLAVNHYKNNPDVKLLFIHTYENVADPLTDAKNFLAKRDYSLDLYMDQKDKVTKSNTVARAFNVNGIPAKFIIDANGDIRFKAEGIEGTAEEIAEEVVQMIELAREKV